MPADNRPLLAGLLEQLGLLGADLREMAALRWQLARLELQTDVRAFKHLALAMFLAAVMALCALPLLAVWAAEMLHQRLGINFSGWLLIFAVALLLGGAAAGCLAWRRFRARFTAMEQTREELCEDLVWLQQWAAARGEGGGRKDEG